MIKQYLTFLLASFAALSTNPKIGETLGDIRDSFLRDSATLLNAANRNAYDNANNDPNVYKNKYFAPYYFKNLTDGFGINTKGTCGYVATGMLLSFWDTYYNDNLVNENYEKKSELAVNHTYLGAKSSGIMEEPESLYSANAHDYYSNITTYKDDYFHFFLLDMGKSLFNFSEGVYGFAHSNYETLFRHYLSNYKGLANNQIEIIKSTSASNARQVTIDCIRRGIPVKLSITDNNNQNSHAVVAYDYDESTDQIYCHFGWGENTTHVTIESMEYKYYKHAIAFNILTDHVHSDNYTYTNGSAVTGHCACETAIPYQIDGDFTYADQIPAFSWRCLCEERWFRNTGIYRFRLLGSTNYNVFYSTDVANGASSITLNTAQLQAIANNADSARGFIVEVALFQSSSSTSPLYRYGRTCYLPMSYNNANNLFLTLSNLGKSNGKWKIKVTNPTCVRVSGEYNSKMCNFNDAKNWTSSLTNKLPFAIAPKSSKEIYISENWFATSITVSWVFGGKRYVTYADHLNNNGTLTTYTNRI